MNYLYLIASIVNLIFGVLMITNSNMETPGLTIVLFVALILIAFGVWGFTLWIKVVFKNQPIEMIENWWKMIKPFDAILVIGLIFRLFIFQPFIVDGPSMEKNYFDKQYIIVDEISYRFNEPARGDVVIFKAPPQPEDDYIKRIVGLPGETVTIDKGQVYVNGQPLEETYITPENHIPADSEYLQKKLGPDEYFVLGDNRPESFDSRDWGVLPKKNIIGKSAMIIYPFNYFQIVKNNPLNI